jgi:hypothetical protein
MPGKKGKRLGMPPSKTKLGNYIRTSRLDLNLTQVSMKIAAQQARRMEIRRSPSVCCGSLQTLASALELNPAVLAPFVGPTRKESKSELGNLVRVLRKELGMLSKALECEILDKLIPEFR